ncbi:MAG TPA: outer membrane protein [Pseudolabrys sp.]|jgi:outer membrane immunogenic protein|nr:outer membrane protein [Pseudolabrys sp.]
MKRLVLAGIGALALVSTLGTANAADLPRREAMPTKAPIYAPIYNWTGAYVGINGGGGWGRSDTSAPFASGSFNTSGAVVGGTLGYNYQVGQTVFGLEGDVDWSNVRGSSTCGAGFSCETKNSWLATARGRIGYAFDRVMPYVTGGLAVGDIKSSVAGIGSSTQTKAGWTLGGGVEAAIAGPWTAKVEYLYADLGRGSSMLGSDTKFNTSLVRAGVNYRF